MPVSQLNIDTKSTKTSPIGVAPTANEQLYASEYNSVFSKVNNLASMESIKNLASGATLTIPDGGRVFFITGTTNIENINVTNFLGGEQIIFIFEGVLTITHNDTVTGSERKIILNDASDYTTSVGDVLQFRYNNVNDRFEQEVLSLTTNYEHLKVQSLSESGNITLDCSYDCQFITQSASVTVNALSNVKKGFAFQFVVTGDYTFTLPANFKEHGNNDEFDGTKQNIYTCLVQDDTGGSEIILYTLIVIDIS